jgi:protein-tyrosine kinase
MSFIKKAVERHKAEVEAEADIHVDIGTKSENAVVEESLKTSTTKIADKRIINIDIEKLANLGMLVPNTTNRVLAEEMRIVKRTILKDAFPEKNSVRNNNIVVVTSSLPGEGKTFVSTNLALSVAMELDRSVLLIDADVIRGGLIEYLGLERSPGLTDMLQDRSMRVEEILCKTNINGLNLIAPGTKCPNTAELFSSSGMKRLIQELAARYDDRLIVIDSPPLLATSDAMYLASIADQVIFVVDSESTVEQRVSDALSQLDDQKAVKLLLNKRHLPAMVESYYSYDQDTD